MSTEKTDIDNDSSRKPRVKTCNNSFKSVKVSIERSGEILKYLKMKQTTESTNYKKTEIAKYKKSSDPNKPGSPKDLKPTRVDKEKSSKNTGEKRKEKPDNAVPQKKIRLVDFDKFISNDDEDSTCSCGGKKKPNSHFSKEFLTFFDDEESEEEKKQSVKKPETSKFKPSKSASANGGKNTIKTEVKIQKRTKKFDQNLHTQKKQLNSCKYESKSEIKKKYIDKKKYEITSLKKTEEKPKPPEPQDEELEKTASFKNKFLKGEFEKNLPFSEIIKMYVGTHNSFSHRFERFLEDTKLHTNCSVTVQSQIVERILETEAVLRGYSPATQMKCANITDIEPKEAKEAQTKTKNSIKRKHHRSSQSPSMKTKIKKCDPSVKTKDKEKKKKKCKCKKILKLNKSTQTDNSSLDTFSNLKENNNPENITPMDCLLDVIEEECKRINKCTTNNESNSNANMNSVVKISVIKKSNKTGPLLRKKHTSLHVLSNTNTIQPFIKFHKDDNYHFSVQNYMANICQRIHENNFQTFYDIIYKGEKQFSKSFRSFLGKGSFNSIQLSKIGKRNKINILKKPKKIPKLFNQLTFIKENQQVVHYNQCTNPLNLIERVQTNNTFCIDLKELDWYGKQLSEIQIKKIMTLNKPPKSITPISPSTSKNDLTETLCGKFSDESKRMILEIISDPICSGNLLSEINFKDCMRIDFLKSKIVEKLTEILSSDNGNEDFANIFSIIDISKLVLHLDKVNCSIEVEINGNESIILTLEEQYTNLLEIYIKILIIKFKYFLNGIGSKNGARSIKLPNDIKTLNIKTNSSNKNELITIDLTNRKPVVHFGGKEFNEFPKKEDPDLIILSDSDSDEVILIEHKMEEIDDKKDENSFDALQGSKETSFDFNIIEDILQLSNLNKARLFEQLKQHTYHNKPGNEIFPIPTVPEPTAEFNSATNNMGIFNCDTRDITIFPIENNKENSPNNIILYSPKDNLSQQLPNTNIRHPINIEQRKLMTSQDIENEVNGHSLSTKRNNNTMNSNTLQFMSQLNSQKNPQFDSRFSLQPTSENNSNWNSQMNPEADSNSLLQAVPQSIPSSVSQLNFQRSSGLNCQFTPPKNSISSSHINSNHQMNSDTNLQTFPHPQIDPFLILSLNSHINSKLNNHLSSHQNSQLQQTQINTPINPNLNTQLTPQSSQMFSNLNLPINSQLHPRLNSLLTTPANSQSNQYKIVHLTPQNNAIVNSQLNSLENPQLQPQCSSFETKSNAELSSQTQNHQFHPHLPPSLNSHQSNYSAASISNPQINSMLNNHLPSPPTSQAYTIRPVPLSSLNSLPNPQSNSYLNPTITTQINAKPNTQSSTLTAPQLTFALNSRETSNLTTQKNSTVESHLPLNPQLTAHLNPPLNPNRYHQPNPHSNSHQISQIPLPPNNSRDPRLTSKLYSQTNSEPNIQYNDRSKSSLNSQANLQMQSQTVNSQTSQSDPKINSLINPHYNNWTQYPPQRKRPRSFPTAKPHQPGYSNMFHPYEKYNPYRHQRLAHYQNMNNPTQLTNNHAVASHNVYNTAYNHLHARIKPHK